MQTRNFGRRSFDWSMKTRIHGIWNRQWLRFFEVKNLLSIHMMQRPRTAKGKGNGKGKDFGKVFNPKGKGKGKGKGKSFWDRSNLSKKTWQSNWGKTTSDGTQFCHRFHLYNTCTSPQCKFSHSCPVIVNGKVCGQKHRAYDHPKGKN